MATVLRKRSDLSPDEIGEIFKRIKVFEFKGTKVRTVKKGNQTWVVFADLCKALGYKNPSSQKKYVSENDMTTLDIGLKNVLANCINRRGLMYLTMISDKPDRKEFADWAVKNIFQS